MHAGVALAGDQIEAFDRINHFIERTSDPYFVLQGLAGTGKTTVLGKVGRRHPSSMMCTLAAKAASVLRAKTGMEADTIHSLFYKLRGYQKDERGKRQVVWDEAWRPGTLEGHIVLLDECSMVNVKMGRDMLRAGARIVACGDPGQLPPVEGQQFFRKPNFLLRTIHRQALESPIIRQAHRVRARHPYAADGPNFQVKYGNCREDILAADAVIVWKNQTRKELTSIIRRLHGIAPSLPKAGEPVMCLKNSGDYGVYNGVVYTLLEPFDGRSHQIVVEVDGYRTEIPGVTFEDLPGALRNDQEATTRFTFGYVITCHKAQGSEYPFVLILDEYAADDYRTEWLYTAITRASERVVIVPR